MSDGGCGKLNTCRFQHKEVGESPKVESLARKCERKCQHRAAPNEQETMGTINGNEQQQRTRRQLIASRDGGRQLKMSLREKGDWLLTMAVGRVEFRC